MSERLIENLRNPHHAKSPTLAESMMRQAADEIERLRALAVPQTVGETLAQVLERQAAWSLKTFGPVGHTHGLIDHIRKELVEIAKDPSDILEWVDVAMLALDGAWRHSSPAKTAAAYSEKLSINERRQWPDWRTVDPTKAVEHIKPASPHSRPEREGQR